MQPDLRLRIGPDWQADLHRWKMLPQPFGVISDRWGGFFGPLRNLLGVQKLCTLFYDDPSFLEEMMDANADFIIAMMAQVLDEIEIDVPAVTSLHAPSLLRQNAAAFITS